ncbi:MAG: hypothetical protein RLZZ245_3885 [Verrucomicrobiota bacterium]
MGRLYRQDGHRANEQGPSFVNNQLELVPKESREASEGALARSRVPAQSHKGIRIFHEIMPSLFEFMIYFIEPDICQ